jgi:D-aminopeptidase
VDNAMIAARTMTGANYIVAPALPHDELQRVLREHKLLNDQALKTAGTSK